MDCVDYPRGRAAVAKRIFETRDWLVRAPLTQGNANFRGDLFGVGADQPGGAGFDGFLSFGFVAHDQHRDAKGRPFLLDSA